MFMCCLSILLSFWKRVILAEFILVSPDYSAYCLIVGSHDHRNLQLSKSCISLQLFERINGRQKEELKQA